MLILEGERGDSRGKESARWLAAFQACADREATWERRAIEYRRLPSRSFSVKFEQRADNFEYTVICLLQVDRKLGERDGQRTGLVYK